MTARRSPRSCSPERSTSVRSPSGRPRWYEENAVELLLGDPREQARPAPATGRARARAARCDYEQLLIATGAAPRRCPRSTGFANVHCPAHPRRRPPPARQPWSRGPPGDRRRRVHRPGGRGDRAPARRRGDDHRGAAAAARPAPRRAVGRLVRRAAPRRGRPDAARSAARPRHAATAGSRSWSLADGERLGCDAVVVGVGIAPATGWLAGSGLDVDGVRVDAAGRTAIPDVFAAGDAARPFDPRFGAHARTEHWDAAAGQGAAAAKAMLGERPGPRAAAELLERPVRAADPVRRPRRRADRVGVEGDPDARDFTAVYTRGDRPVAALSGRPAAGAPGTAQANRGRASLTPDHERRRWSDELHPSDRRVACSAHGDCVEIAPEVFASTRSRW